MRPETDGSMNSLLVGVAPRSDFLAAEDSMKIEVDLQLKKESRYKLENERLKNFILEKDAALKAMSIRLVDMENNDAIFKTEKGCLAMSHAELLSFATRKGAKSTRTRDTVLLKSIPPMYLGFARYVMKAIVPYFCSKILRLLLLL